MEIRILQLTKHYPPYFGGIESVTYDLTEGANKLGYKTDVLCANNKISTFYEQIDNYKIWRMASWGKVMSTSVAPSIIIQLEKVKGDYDIIHVHFPDPMNTLALYLARPKARILVHWHSDIVNQKGLLLLYKPLQDWVLKRSHVIVGTSPKYINESQQLLPFLKKTKAIPIGISDDKIISSATKVSEIRERFRGKKIVFSLGRLIYYKGFEYLIEAAKDLDNYAVVLIGGEGRLAEKLSKHIQRADLQDKVYLLGGIPQSELGSYFEACDVFCLPSIERSEAFGVVMLEAMSYGKPIVATEIPASGVSWVNEHGVTGFNVPVRSSIHLAERINLLLNNKDIYREFASNSKKRFQKKFTSQLMVEQFVQLYDTIMNQ